MNMIAKLFPPFSRSSFLSTRGDMTGGGTPRISLELPHMSKNELEEILKNIDQALLVYRTHEGLLSTLEVSLKSMLTVVRAQVAEQLAGVTAGAAAE